MPNGKTHDIITLITTPVVGLIGYNILDDYRLFLLLIISYIFSSFMFNGDLDTNSSVYNRWWFFKVIWVPYQIIFNHRSIFTHGIIIGTIVRLIWISPLVIIIYRVFDFNLNLINSLIIILGLELGNINHSLSDKIGSWLKSKF
ncbi:MAG: metal-binding protein [bacterium]